MFQDRRLEPSTALLTVFALAAFPSAYGLARLLFWLNETLGLCRLWNSQGNDLLFGLTVLGLTGLLFAVFARCVTRILVWPCLMGAVVACLIGVIFTILFVMVGALSVGAHPIVVVYASVVAFMVWMTPLTVMTVFSALVGYALVELVGQWILRQGPAA
jgi:hypothetical protein